MARQLQQLPSHGTRHYPWDRWENGNPWKVVRGVDFECLPAVFRRMLAVRAGRQKLKVSTRVEGDNVMFQFRKVKSAKKRKA